MAEIVKRKLQDTKPEFYRICQFVIHNDYVFQIFSDIHVEMNKVK